MLNFDIYQAEEYVSMFGKQKGKKWQLCVPDIDGTAMFEMFDTRDEAIEFVMNNFKR